MKTCELCGCEFTGRTHPGGRKERFCSDNCRVKAGYRRTRGLRTNAERLEAMHGARTPSLALAPEQAAWLAAMVDGEGCLAFHRRESRAADGQNYYFPAVTALCNTNETLVRHTATLLGGVAKTVRNRVANGKHKGRYEVKVKRLSMRAFLEAIRPYLVAKTRQADLLLEYLGTHDAMLVRTAPPLRFEQIWREMATLNRRGVSQEV